MKKYIAYLPPIVIALSIVTAVGLAIADPPTVYSRGAYTRGETVSIEFSDGTASAPSITNSGNTNTGVYFPAADTLGVTTGGTSRMTVNEDGQWAYASCSLDDPTGNEIGFDFPCAENKATSGNATCVKIAQTATASPGTSTVLDVSFAGSSLLVAKDTGVYVNDDGATTTEFSVKTDTVTVLLTDAVNNTITFLGAIFGDPAKFSNGTEAAPGVAFTDPDNGLFGGTNILGMTAGGAEVWRATPGQTTANNNGNDQDFVFKGDNDATLLVLDAGEDTVVIGAASTGASKFRIAGDRTLAAWGVTGPTFSTTASTLTDSSTTSGTVASAVASSFGIPTLALASGSATFTNGAALYIAGDIAAGTGVTFTNAYGLWNAGKSLFGGQVRVVPANNAAAPDYSFSTATGYGMSLIGNTTLTTFVAGTEYLHLRTADFVLNDVSVAGFNVRFESNDNSQKFLLGGTANTLQVAAGTASSALADIGGQLNGNVTEVGNVGAGEDDLISYSLPANALVTPLDSITIRAAGTFSADVETREVKVKFGSTTIFDSGALVGAESKEFSVTCKIIAESTSAQKSVCHWESSFATLNVSMDYTEPAETLTSAVTIKLTGEATTNNSIVNQFLTVGYN